MPSETDLLSYAHEVATGFYALDVAVDEVASWIDERFDSLKGYDVEYLRNNVDVVRRQVAAQMYEAMNFLHHAAPQFAGTLHPTKWTQMNPVELLKPMLKAYEAKVKRRQIELRLELPRGTPTPLLRVEELAMRRALHNVLTNALKYSYQGSDQQFRFVRIWPGWIFEGTERWWAMHFQNYGVGVLPEELERVFEPGYRGELARADGTVGSGLGLPEVAKCMRIHGGRVTLVSRRVPGDTYLTTVSLLLPT